MGCYAGYGGGGDTRAGALFYTDAQFLIPVRFRGDECSNTPSRCNFGLPFGTDVVSLDCGRYALYRSNLLQVNILDYETEGAGTEIGEEGK